MEELMLSSTPLEQREQILRDSCDKVVEKSYTRRFEQGTINERRAELANVMIKINDLENELSEIKAQFKGKIKPLIERLSKIRNELKVGGEWVTTECYEFCDDEARRVGVYNPEGYLIEERPMTQDERQKTVFRAIRSTGTEG